MFNATDGLNCTDDTTAAVSTEHHLIIDGESYNGELSTSQIIFFTITFSLASVIGLFGNSIVITVILFKRELRRFTNFFFLNLSIADILVLIVCIPTVLQDIHLPDRWIYGELSCHCYFFVEYCLTSVSSLTIIIISFERYAAISAPLKVKQIFSSRISILAILLIWIVSMIFTSPIIKITKFHSYVEKNETFHQCYLDITHFYFIYMIFYTSIIIFIPTVFLSFLYIMIIFKLKINYKCTINEIYMQANKCLLTNSATANGHHNHHQTTTLSSLTDRSLASNTSRRQQHQYQQRRSHHQHKRKHQLMRIEYRKSLQPNFTQQRTSNGSSHNKNSGANLVNTNGYVFRKIRVNRNNSVISLMSYSSTTHSSFRTLNGMRLSISNNNTPTGDLLNKNNSKNKPSKSTKTWNDRKRFTIIILLITVAFFCCQLPIRIFILWAFNYRLSQADLPSFANVTATTQTTNCTASSASSYHHQQHELNYELINTISFIARLIYFLHTLSNPLIYNISSSKFRRAFFSLFCLSKCQ